MLMFGMLRLSGSSCVVSRCGRQLRAGHGSVMMHPTRPWTQSAARPGHVRHGLLRPQLPGPDPEGGAAPQAGIPPHPDLHGLIRLPHHLLARPLPSARQHRGETRHRHDDPPHPHLHVRQREAVGADIK